HRRAGDVVLLPGTESVEHGIGVGLRAGADPEGGGGTSGRRRGTDPIVVAVDRKVVAVEVGADSRARQVDRAAAVWLNETEALVHGALRLPWSLSRRADPHVGRGRGWVVQVAHRVLDVRVAGHLVG